jgi:ferredoxin/flavodoxin
VKINVYYFSGTGNTAWVVKRLAERLTELGDAVVATSCERVVGSDVDPAACDVMGIAFPVYASFAPSLVRDFIAGLPPAAGKPLFAVTTAGYAAGDTAWYAVGPLRAKGYGPFVLANVLVANNLRLPVLLPLPIPSPEEMVGKLERACGKVDRLAGWIHRRERHVEGVGLFGRLLGVSQRLSVGPFEALAFQGFFADETCTRCGWCVGHCPVQNIEMTDDGVGFLDRCMLCMRCYSFCPRQAIQSTEKTKDTERYRRYPGPEGRPYPLADVTF